MSYSGIRWRRHVLLDLEYCNAHYCDRVRTTDVMRCYRIRIKENVCYDAVEQCSRECWRMAPGGWNGSSCNLYITRSEIGVMHKLCSTNCADLAILLRHMADQCEGR